MTDLLDNEWIQGPQAHSSTPLMTPKLLSFRQPRIESGVKATMKAFHKAHREGFRLMDVSNAPIAKRRKLKKDSSTETRSSSGESIHSPGSSQGRTTPTQQQQFINPNARTTSGGFDSVFLPTLQQVKQGNSTDSIGFSPVLPPLGTPDMTPPGTQVKSNAGAISAAAAAVRAAAATAGKPAPVNATTISTNNNTVTIVKGVPTAQGTCCVTQSLNPLDMLQLQQQQAQSITTAYAIPTRLVPHTVPLITQQQYAPTHLIASLPTIQENQAFRQVAPAAQLLVQSVPTTQSVSKVTSQR